MYTVHVNVTLIMPVGNYGYVFIIGGGGAGRKTEQRVWGEPPPDAEGYMHY